jgi:hypothetical protein
MLLALSVVCFVAPALISQSAQLRVLSATPTGELNQLSEANEVRVIFSEPMVALGRVPSNPTPAWIHITPVVKGLVRWSGTSVLVFTPDPSALPMALHGDDRRISGKRLGSCAQAPFVFTFTTPTVKRRLRWCPAGWTFTPSRPRRRVQSTRAC